MAQAAGVPIERELVELLDFELLDFELLDLELLELDGGPELIELLELDRFVPGSSPSE